MACHRGPIREDQQEASRGGAMEAIFSVQLRGDHRSQLPNRLRLTSDGDEHDLWCLQWRDPVLGTISWRRYRASRNRRVTVTWPATLPTTLRPRAVPRPMGGASRFTGRITPSPHTRRNRPLRGGNVSSITAAANPLRHRVAPRCVPAAGHHRTYVGTVTLSPAAEALSLLAAEGRGVRGREAVEAFAGEVSRN